MTLCRRSSTLRARLINRFQKTRDPFSGDERFTASEGKFELLSDAVNEYLRLIIRTKP